jgi:serine O-acetyltransferase
MATDTRLKEQLPDLTDRIVATYTEVGKINHLGHTRLPSTEAVIEICRDLEEIIYPGYGRRQNLHLANVMYHVGDLIDGLHDKLTLQVARALVHEHEAHAHAHAPTLALPLRGREGDGGSARVGVEHDFEALAQQKTIEFLNRLPELRGVLADDVQAAYDGDPAAKGLDEIIFCYPGIEAVTIYRLAHELYRLGVPFIPRMMTEWAHSKTGIDIHPGAMIGRSFFIDHGTGVVVGETCEIGDHVKLYQGVTLGALSFPMDERGRVVRGQKRHPTIEDHVIVYANATILGGATVIGHHSIVGSSVWLTRSTAPYTLVSMEKPSLRYKDAASKGPSELEGDYQI